MNLNGKLLQRATLILICFLGLGLPSCSSAQHWNQPPPSPLDANGPSILNARTEPGVVTLNRDLQPNERAEIIADVKDVSSPISEVKVQFRDIPLLLQMEKIGGSTWRAEITPQQLQMFAVAGTTIEYKADIIATDQKGAVSSVGDLISLAITAPDQRTKKRLS